jgi:hypothetical protein
MGATPCLEEKLSIFVENPFQLTCDTQKGKKRKDECEMIEKV